MTILHNIDKTKDVIHPIKIWHIYDEDVIVNAPAELEGLAKKLEVMNDPTSDEALSLIWRECEEYLNTIGYADDRFKQRRNIIFVKSFPIELNREKMILPAKYENLTTLDPESAPAYVTLLDGKIVSAALAYLCEDGAYEICTETAPAYRGRGYASENVAALSDILVREGETVFYLSSEANERSRRVAEKAGFIEVGISYDYTVRRKDMKNGI